jgi:hypothetical protein
VSSNTFKIGGCQHHSLRQASVFGQLLNMLFMRLAVDICHRARDRPVMKSERPDGPTTAASVRDSDIFTCLGTRINLVYHIVASESSRPPKTSWHVFMLIEGYSF